jgi:hypothetical protein
VQRIVKIKHNSGGTQERPVIKLGVCLGSIYRETEVNLQDRGHMNYQMLIGREFMKGDFLVDPNAVFINPPRCEKEITIDSHE